MSTRKRPPRACSPKTTMPQTVETAGSARVMSSWDAASRLAWQALCTSQPAVILATTAAYSGHEVTAAVRPPAKVVRSCSWCRPRPGQTPTRWRRRATRPPVRLLGFRARRKTPARGTGDGRADDPFRGRDVRSRPRLRVQAGELREDAVGHAGDGGPFRQSSRLPRSFALPISVSGRALDSRGSAGRRQAYGATSQWRCWASVGEGVGFS